MHADCRGRRSPIIFTCISASLGQLLRTTSNFHGLLIKVLSQTSPKNTITKLNSFMFWVFLPPLQSVKYPRQHSAAGMSIASVVSNFVDTYFTHRLHSWASIFINYFNLLTVSCSTQIPSLYWEIIWTISDHHQDVSCFFTSRKTPKPHFLWIIKLSNICLYHKMLTKLI